MEVAIPPAVGQRKVPNLPKRMWVTKLSLRCISAAFCLVIIGSCAGTYWIYPMIMAPAGGVLIWDIAEGITLIVRRRSYKGIHPGACVGVDLVLWLALGALSGAMIPVASYGDGYSYSSYGSYSSYDYLTDSTLLIVAISFGFIVTLLHIALFIIACVETHRRRHANVPYAPAQFNPHQQPFNPNQQQPFNPNQQPPFNPHQPPTGFVPLANPFSPPQQGMQYYPPPGGAGWPQTQAQTPPPQRPVAQTTATSSSQTPQWLGSVSAEMSNTPSPHAAQPAAGSQSQSHFSGSSSQAGVFTGAPGGQHEMSNTPRPAVAQFNGGPPNATAGPQTGTPTAQHEMSNTPAPHAAQPAAAAGFNPATGGYDVAALRAQGYDPAAIRGGELMVQFMNARQGRQGQQSQQQQQGQQQQGQTQFGATVGTPVGSQTASPPPRYEMYVRGSGPDGGVVGHEMGGGR